MLRMNRFGGKIKVLTTVLTWLLILAGAIETVWGLCQVYGYTASNHSLYALTGFFYNPGVAQRQASQLLACIWWRSGGTQVVRSPFKGEASYRSSPRTLWPDRDLRL